MLIDARELETGALLEGDLCVVGAGAAGIAIALQFVGTGHRVLLVESGGLEIDGATQALYEGVNLGREYYELEACRLRFFGGTTNHWEGRCRPLDPLDFEPRAWVPHSGWPISRASLDPYYARAHELCQLGPYSYDPGFWFLPGEAALPFDPALVATGLWQFSPPTRFGKVYREPLARATDVRVLLNANLVDIETGEEGAAVRALRIATLEGKRFTVQARAYVLACGGLENARLLLAANRQVNVGLGNRHGNVGRYFMEHAHLPGARLLAAAPSQIGFYTYEERQPRHGGTLVMGHLRLAPDLQTSAGLLNCDCNFVHDNVGASGYAALRRMLTAVEHAKLPDHLLADLALALEDFDDTFAGLLGRLGLREYHPDQASFVMWSTLEQAPNPDSRVTLAAETDALGLPRIRLDWRLSEADKRSLQEVHRTLAEEFGRSGLGRLQIDEWVDADLTTWSPRMIGGHHHMGTTRMSDDPRTGVVDRDCRVHDMANLFIAGSSVFPTGGSANPTLTIVALALRMADHLREQVTATG
ncbi:MAG TPA: FAD-dependent oxidoreductase [Geminicoccaceae bacterium]|nr:FAD-dependent oxidoreductase [Geminicoccaceae bacterium]